MITGKGQEFDSENQLVQGQMVLQGLMEIMGHDRNSGRDNTRVTGHGQRKYGLKEDSADDHNRTREKLSKELKVQS